MKRIGQHMRQSVKEAAAKSGRIWSGPAAGLHIEGDRSLRTFLGLYELELNSWIKRLALPGTPTFDLGASVGFDGLMFANMGASPVLCVEGNPALLPTIQANIERNHLNGSILTEVSWVGDGSPGTVTIDALSARHFVPAFIKMDIEGGEASALRGAQEALNHCRGWLVETHSLETENLCITAFTRRGYRLEIINQRRWPLPESRPLPHNRWLVAIRPD